MTYVIHIKAMDLKAIHFSYAYSYKNPRGERRRANRVSLPRPEAGRHDPRVRSRYKIATSTSTASTNRRFFFMAFSPQWAGEGGGGCRCAGQHGGGRKARGAEKKMEKNEKSKEAISGAFQKLTLDCGDLKNRIRS